MAFKQRFALKLWRDDSHLKRGPAPAACIKYCLHKPVAAQCV